MKLFLTTLVSLSLCFSTFSQKKNSLKAYLDHKIFYSHEIGNYVEIHIQFVAYSLKFQPTEFSDSNTVQSGLQSEVAIQYVFKKEDKILKTDAYRLRSPIMRDSIIEDFYEIKRIPLEPGDYTMELTLTDLHSEGNPVSAIQPIVIDDLGQKASLSNIETAEVIVLSKQESVFSKSGHDIIPRISNYYAAEAMKIPIYFEIYSPKNDTSVVFGLKQSVKNQRNQTEIESLTRYTKVEVNGVQPVIRAIDISKLPTGEYILELSLINQQNEELSLSTYFFERFSNEEYATISAQEIVLDPKFQESISEDSLSFYVASLIPISKPAEIKNIITLLKTKDKQAYRKYIQAYWVNSSSGINAYEAWLKYKTQVQIVQQLFSNNFMNGFETDRGRVYLQYGPPSNVIVRENSPSDYPYEIWRYDKILTFSNRRFIFYNPDLVNNAYRLLHSDMRGELQNYRWQQQLSKRNSTNSNIDDPNDGNFKHYGGNSEELFRQY